MHALRYINADLKISPYICVHTKIISWKFRILNPRILELFARQVWIFLKSRLLFNAIYCFCMFVKNIHISKVHISQKVKDVIMRNLRDTIFYMKTNVLQDFCICISVPLKGRIHWNFYFRVFHEILI